MQADNSPLTTERRQDAAATGYRYPPMQNPERSLSFHCPLALDPWLNLRVLVVEGRALYDCEPELLELGWRKRRVDGTGTGSAQPHCLVLPLWKLSLSRWSQAAYLLDLLLLLYCQNNGCPRPTVREFSRRVDSHRRSAREAGRQQRRPVRVLSAREAEAAMLQKAQRRQREAEQLQREYRAALEAFCKPAPA